MLACAERMQIALHGIVRMQLDHVARACAFEMGEVRAAPADPAAVEAEVRNRRHTVNKPAGPGRGCLAPPSSHRRLGRANGGAAGSGPILAEDLFPSPYGYREEPRTMQRPQIGRFPCTQRHLCSVQFNLSFRQIVRSCRRARILQQTADRTPRHARRTGSAALCGGRGDGLLRRMAQMSA